MAVSVAVAVGDIADKLVQQIHTKSQQLIVAPWTYKELIKENGNYFTLISHELGKYGRVLGEILLDDDRNVNDIHIEEKHAYPYTGGNKEEARKAAGLI